MARSLPLIRQESEDNCALACLRMILAGRGTFVTEVELEQHVRKDVNGTDIEELERLARSFGLVATAQEATAKQIRDLLNADSDVIAYVNRTVFDLRTLNNLSPALRSIRGHAVVPIHLTARHITFLDPRLPAVVSKTIRRFEASQKHLGSACLVLSAEFILPEEPVVVHP